MDGLITYRVSSPVLATHICTLAKFHGLIEMHGKLLRCVFIKCDQRVSQHVLFADFAQASKKHSSCSLSAILVNGHRNYGTNESYESHEMMKAMKA